MVLLPLLSDRDEFVRREAAYALGKTGNRAAIPSLVELLNRDRQDAVRGAAAVALGELGDELAVVPLAQILVPARGSRRTKNPFVLMAAARSLGQIGSTAGVPALVITLNNEAADIEVRREAAVALGRIGDASAVGSLQRVLSSTDPYLAEAAREAIKKLPSQ
jgi:HEAT repeat protein